MFVAPMEISVLVAVPLTVTLRSKLKSPLRETNPAMLNVMSLPEKFGPAGSVTRKCTGTVVPPTAISSVTGPPVVLARMPMVPERLRMPSKPTSCAVAEASRAYTEVLVIVFR